MLDNVSNLMDNYFINKKQRASLETNETSQTADEDYRFLILKKLRLTRKWHKFTDEQLLWLTDE